MLVSEEKAADKWCPFTRVLMSQDGSDEVFVGNRVSLWKQDEDFVCLGSDCMAWRWSQLEEGSGYCGLAGPSLR